MAWLDKVGGGEGRGWSGEARNKVDRGGRGGGLGEGAKGILGI